MIYRTRAQNNLRAPRARSTFSKSYGIYVHWTAGPPTQTVRQIQDFHMNSRGWNDIAYSWLVDQNGNIHEGRGWGVSGAHTSGYNSSSHAVCAILGPGHTATQKMKDGIARVIVEHNKKFGTGYVRPHRAVYATSCPGDQLARWVNEKGWQRADVSNNKKFWTTLAQAVADTKRKDGWEPRRARKHYGRLAGAPRWAAIRRLGIVTPGFRKRLKKFQGFMGIPVTGKLDRATRIWLNYVNIAD